MSAPHSPGLPGPKVVLEYLDKEEPERECLLQLLLCENTPLQRGHGRALRTGALR